MFKGLERLQFSSRKTKRDGHMVAVYRRGSETVPYARERLHNSVYHQRAEF